MAKSKSKSMAPLLLLLLCITNYETVQAQAQAQRPQQNTTSVTNGTNTDTAGFPSSAPVIRDSLTNSPFPNSQLIETAMPSNSNYPTTTGSSVPITIDSTAPVFIPSTSLAPVTITSPAPLANSRDPVAISINPSQGPSTDYSFRPSSMPSSSYMPSYKNSTSPSTYPSTITTTINNNSISMSMAPSMAPSSPTTTISSTTLPSSYPSNAPSAKTYSLDTNVSIVLLQPSTAPWSTQTTETFRNLTQAFLTESLEVHDPPITNVMVEILDVIPLNNRRNLQSLQQSKSEIQLLINGTSTINTINLEQLIQVAFSTQGFVLLGMLQATSNTQLNNVETITVLTTQEPSTPPVASPTTSLQIPNARGSETSQDEELPLYAWIGIGVGAAAVVMILLIAIFIVIRRRRQHRDTTEPPIRTTTTNSPVAPKPSIVASMGSNMSDVQSYANDNATLNNVDNMSYAYSLEHGIEDQSSTGGYDASTVGGYDSQSYSTVSYGRGGRMPMEIPNLSKTITRECFAPPGKLGIVIDTTMQGPVVHRVNAGSPLEGIVWPGDVIIAIDETDTKAMSASAITALMAKNMNKRRRLTILSEDK